MNKYIYKKVYPYCNFDIGVVFITGNNCSLYEIFRKNIMMFLYGSHSRLYLYRIIQGNSASVVFDYNFDNIFYHYNLPYGILTSEII